MFQVRVKYRLAIHHHTCPTTIVILCPMGHARAALTDSHWPKLWCLAHAAGLLSIHPRTWGASCDQDKNVPSRTEMTPTGALWASQHLPRSVGPNEGAMPVACAVLPFASVPRPTWARERTMSMPLAISKLPFISAVVVCKCPPAALRRPPQSGYWQISQSGTNASFVRH